MKRATIALAAGFFGLATIATAEPLPGADVESLLAIAREASPDLRGSRLEAEAARERVGSAGALPDPFLRIELENITRNDTRSPTLAPSQVGETKYLLAQPLPFWGKRDLRRDIAAAEAEQAGNRAVEAWVEVAARIKLLYVQYWQTDHSLRIARENIALAGQLERIAQARYAGGLAAQQDAIRAQVERSQLESEQVVLETDLRRATTQINALLARPPTAPLAAPAALRPLPPGLDATALGERLRRANPQLAAEAARVDGADKSRELAYRNRYPDFIVGIQPIQMQNSVDAWNLMFEMSIPLQQGARRSQEREAERMLEAAAARREALGHRLAGELGGTLAGLDAARATERIARERLLPQAELTFRSALAGYETGKVDFATVLDAQRQIRNARLGLLRAQAGQQASLAEIERLIGEEL
ncbi:MAG: TolC family protein [Betaproteobacteria bacterium]|nr:TolC family protein [Betaproteobacteria bacterium]